MITRLHTAAIFQQVNHVCMAHGGKAVRDDQAGAADHKFDQRALGWGFGLCRGRFVQIKVFKKYW